MSKFINALGKSILTLLIMLLIGYGWAFFEIKIMLKSNPELFGYVFYQYKLEDMMPTINEDDVIIVSKNQNINVGDTIMYLEDNNQYAVRNVTNIDSNSASVTCDLCDETTPIKLSTVVGRVVGKFALLGKFINFFKQKWFLIALAITGFTFVVVSQYIHEKPKKIS